MPEVQPTNNPVPSDHPADARDNFKRIDEVVNLQSNQSSPTRTGKRLETLYGLEQQYLQAIQQAGGTPLNNGVWGAGQTFTSYNQFMIFNNIPYRPLTSTTLPYGPTGASPDPAFVGPYEGLSLQAASKAFSNQNLINNPRFEISSSISNPPDATPRNYSTGDELFFGVFAVGALTGVTDTGGELSGSGQLYTDVYKSEKQKLSTASYVASIAGSDGSPVESGASFIDSGDYWRVTFDMSDTFSVKFEQGGTATKHNAVIPVISQSFLTVDVAVTQSISLGSVVAIFDRNAEFEAVLTSSVTPNGYNVVQMVSNPNISLNLRVDGSITSTSFGFKKDGTDESTTLQAFRDYAIANPEIILVFTEGDYTYSTSPNWSIPNLTVKAEGRVNMKNVGTGPHLIFDNPSGTTFNVNWCKDNDMYAEGNENTGDGVYVRSTHHSDFNVNVRGCGGQIYNQEFGVLNSINVKSSINQGPFTSTPNPAGILLTRRNAGEESSACRIINPLVEGMRSQGIVLDYALNTIVDGGTSEANAGANVECTANSRNNKFNGIDLEVSGSGQGYLDRGRFNELNEVFNDAATTITSGAVGAMIRGGILDSLSNAGDYSTFRELKYGANGGELSDSTSNATIYDIYDIESATFKEINKDRGGVNDVITVSTGQWAVPSAVPGNVVKQVPLVGVSVGDAISIGSENTYNSAFLLTAIASAQDQIDIIFTQISGAAQSPLPDVGSYNFTIAIKGKKS